MDNEKAKAVLGYAVAAALAAAAVAIFVHGGGGGGGRGDYAAPRDTSWLRASRSLTPGALNRDVTQETIGKTICVRGWTRTIRPPVEYTNRLKQRQLLEWQLPGTLRDYQEDHLISLELGGHPTDPRNLWPEPRPYAEQVDQLEHALRRAVCSGRLSLREAQLREARQKHERG